MTKLNNTLHNVYIFVNYLEKHEGKSLALNILYIYYY